MRLHIARWNRGDDPFDPDLKVYQVYWNIKKIAIISHPRHNHGISN